MENSTHKVEIVSVTLRKHDNADSLSVVDVFGYTAVVRTADWQDGQLGAYLPPDSVVDVFRPEFAFLGGGTKTHSRIKAKKLRGVQSFGLLIPAPVGSRVGDDVAELLGVTHYEPELASCCSGGEAEAAPAHLAHLSKFDVDALRRYPHLFEPGEEVLVTEKIHGANARYCFLDGRMWCGSRTEWKRYDEGNMWWQALDATSKLREWLESHPEYVVYGEVYGDVQSYRYGMSKGQCQLVAFDLWVPEGKWADADTARFMMGSLPQVPVLHHGPFDFDAICKLAEGPSLMPGADHIREGCVVKPLKERWDEHVGRVCLKVVGAGYLEKE